jgi:hypothetical protein
VALVQRQPKYLPPEGNRFILPTNSAMHGNVNERNVTLTRFRFALSKFAAYQVSGRNNLLKSIGNYGLGNLEPEY